MSNHNWHETEFLDDIEEQDTPDRSRIIKGKERKRKWREIENIKEQRRLRRDLATYEHYSY